MRRGALALALVAGAACPKTPPTTGGSVMSEPAPPPGKPVVVTIVGTNDLHGRVEALPVLGGYLAILRELRAADGGVLLLDGGDMFQGTLESNLSEGAAVVRAYNALGYHAAAIGNHEFDFGPAGEAATPKLPTDDPRGALKARAAEARFPFLMANVEDAATHAAPLWPNVRPSAVVEVAGVKVGVIGVTTMATPASTIAANFRGLAMKPTGEAIVAEAKRLRAGGAALVVVAAHLGSRCKAFEDPKDVSSCDQDDEVFRLAAELPPGAIDAIVAGHSHAGVAHLVRGIPVIESYAGGRAFGRIDLTWDPAAGRVVETRVHPPRNLCAKKEGPCQPEPYEGKTVAPDASIARVLQPDVERARRRREEPLGVTIEAPLWKKYGEESPEGNLFADLMLKARPEADVALTNGGGLRADLPAGPLTYGRLYEAIPFDNRFAHVSMTGARLERMFAQNLQAEVGILSIAGARVTARCKGSALEVELVRANGRPLRDDERVTVVTSDFLASGGDEIFGPQDAVTLDDALIREEMVALLKQRGGKLRGDDPAIYDPSARRLVYPGPRPVHCPP